MFAAIKRVLGVVGILDPGLSEQQKAYLNELDSWHEIVPNEYVAMVNGNVRVTFSRVMPSLPMDRKSDIAITDIVSLDRGRGNLTKAFKKLNAAADKHEIDTLIDVSRLKFEPEAVSGEPSPFVRFGRFLLKPSIGFEQAPHSGLHFTRHNNSYIYAPGLARNDMPVQSVHP